MNVNFHASPVGQQCPLWWQQGEKELHQPIENLLQQDMQFHNEGSCKPEDEYLVREACCEGEDQWEDCSDDGDDCGAPTMNLGETKKNITFMRLLQHWAVATYQSKSNMTLFLHLLKHCRPVVNYDLLPNTGNTLLKVNKKKKTSTLTTFNNGKYVHFGLEKGVAGESPGLIFENADVMQFASIYQEKPLLVPESIRRKV